MTNPRLWCAALAACFVLAFVAGAQQPEQFAALAGRSIGPAGMSGRVTAVCVDPTSRGRVFYIGAAAGGVWKTDDAGVTFRPVFDDERVASIGALAVHPRLPDMVWVGTGEGNPRNSASVGRGVFLSRDGGESFEEIGLDGSERIHRIVLHPDDPQTAWVAAMGPTWGDSPTRGVFRTTDGGETWQKVLYVDERTGCADLVVDPRHPDKLFAAMWSHRRWPYSFQSGGEGSGLWVSRDGGERWDRLGPDDGMPEGDLGRIGLSIARSNPDVVYALVEAKQSVLLRSDNGGRSFRTVNDDPGIANRPFYYCDIRVDPANPERVYNMASTTRVSDDGGRTFRELVGWDQAHPDHHALWIAPDHGRDLLLGTDGGLYLSADRGRTWRFARNLPLAQFYHVRVDMDRPYHVFGGLQDNGSWRGPSEVWENGGIRNHHWQEVTFGDGFDTIPHPADSMRGFAMSQGGNLYAWDLRTGLRRWIQPPSPDPDVELRFN